MFNQIACRFQLKQLCYKEGLFNTFNEIEVNTSLNDFAVNLFFRILSDIYRDINSHSTKRTKASEIDFKAVRIYKPIFIIYDSSRKPGLEKFHIRT